MKSYSAPSLAVMPLLRMVLSLTAMLPLVHHGFAQSPQGSPAATLSPEQEKQQLEAADGKPTPPGSKEAAKTKALSAGADILQKFAPINDIHAAVCGIHFYSGQPERQVIAHHFCSHLNNEVLQCVLYDTNKSNARLIGVEYIISERLFRACPNWRESRRDQP